MWCYLWCCKLVKTYTVFWRSVMTLSRLGHQMCGISRLPIVYYIVYNDIVPTRTLNEWPNEIGPVRISVQDMDWLNSNQYPEWAIKWVAEWNWPGSDDLFVMLSFVRTVQTDTLYISPEQLKRIHCILAGSSGIGPTQTTCIFDSCWHVFLLFCLVTLCICDQNMSI